MNPSLEADGRIQFLSRHPYRTHGGKKTGGPPLPYPTPETPSWMPVAHTRRLNNRSPFSRPACRERKLHTPFPALLEDKTRQKNPGTIQLLTPRNPEKLHVRYQITSGSCRAGHHDNRAAHTEWSPTWLAVEFLLQFMVRLVGVARPDTVLTHRRAVRRIEVRDERRSRKSESHLGTDLGCSSHAGTDRMRSWATCRTDAEYG